jgi:hypothetical protein
LEVILAVVDKIKVEVLTIFSAKPDKVVDRLKEKLAGKAQNYAEKVKEIRRLQVSLTKGDLLIIEAHQIFPKP